MSGGKKATAGMLIGSDSHYRLPFQWWAATADHYSNSGSELKLRWPNSAGKEYHIHCRIWGVPGMRAPLGVQILSFSCSFQQNICKIIGFWQLAHPPEENSGSATDIIITYPQNLQFSYSRIYSGGSRISPRRGRQLPGGANIRFCQIFPKLQEIERIWTPSGARVPRPP